MRSALKALGLALVGLLVVVGAFWGWAGAGMLSDTELSQLRTYNGVAVPDTTAPDTTRAADPLRVATYNIGYLSGMTNNAAVARSRSLYAQNMDRAVALLRDLDADVVALQEIDFGADRSFNVQQLDTLARRLGYPYAAQAVNWDVRYLPFPYSINPAVHFGRVLSGQAVLSRYPITEHERVELARTSRSALTDRFYLDRLAQGVRIQTPTGPVALLNVHLEAFEQATRETQAQEVAALYRQYAEGEAPVILLGDFNALLPDQPGADGTMAPLLQPLSLQAALPGNRGTYPADAPLRKIDHVLLPEGLRPVGGAVRCGSSASPPSDHCAVVTGIMK